MDKENKEETPRRMDRLYAFCLSQCASLTAAIRATATSHLGMKSEFDKQTISFHMKQISEALWKMPSRSLRRAGLQREARRR